MDSPPLYHLPQDTLHTIFLSLPFRQIIICRSISKPIYTLLTSPSFLHLLSLHHPPRPLLALRHHHHHRRHHNHRHPPSPPPPSPPTLLAFDTLQSTWISFPLSFLPFIHLAPLSSSSGSLFLWADTGSARSLVVCNPLNRTFRVLPPLGSAWSKHGSVLSGEGSRVLVITELATLYFNGVDGWLKYSSNLPAKPRSPVMLGESVYALCDVGSPWRSVWKLFRCELPEFDKTGLVWSKMERSEWGDVFDVLKRPRLVKGVGNKIYMVGGLKSSFSLNAVCSTILILRLDMESLEWDEAGRMPLDMYKCFQESSKFKVFGSGDKVCFSAKRVGKLALWDSSTHGLSVGEWRWIDGPPGFGDGVFRGFVFDAGLDVVL